VKYLSLFSGIEAASVAWRPLGWEPVAFAEIEPFACAVLAHHYPDVPNLGNVEELDEEAYKVCSGATAVVFGSPCQSFSVAGKRLGLDDPRGNLALLAIRVVVRVWPRWVVFENVPGLLSSGQGRDFGAFLGALGQCGYGWAYRVLDAQYVRVDDFERAVPQRRRRVFVVGHLGSWTRAAAVLFVGEGLPGDTAAGRGAGKGVAADTIDRAHDGCQDLKYIAAPQVAPSIGASGRGTARAGKSRGQDPVIVVRPAQTGANGIGVSEGVSHTMDGTGGEAVCYHRNASCQVTEQDGVSAAIKGNGEHSYQFIAAPVAPTMGASGPPYSRTGNERVEAEVLVAHSLRGDGFDASEDGTGRGTPLVAGPVRSNIYNNSDPAMEAKQHVVQGMTVRRLTPRECERLQGFPDDYTLIPWKGRYRCLACGESFTDKNAAGIGGLAPAECPKCGEETAVGYDPPDGPRYKALGNSMAVNVMRWIGTRIQMMEEADEKE